MKIIKNSVHLLGNLGKEVEIMEFGSGTKKAQVSLATTDYYKNNKGDLMKTTQWHQLVAWGKTAEQMAATLQKGNQVAVHGSLNYRTYQADGRQVLIAEVIIDEFMRLNSSQVAKDGL